MKHVQKTAAFLLCLLMLFFVSAAMAGEEDFAFDSQTGTITGWNGTDAQLTIPGSIGGVPVTAIATNAFAGKDTLDTVTFPPGVVTLQKNAFTDCANLSYLVFQSHALPTMQAKVFGNCPIEDIDILWNATRADVQAAQKAARQAGLSAKVWRANAPGLELINDGYTYDKDGKRGYILSAYQGGQSQIYPHYALIHTDGTQLPVYAIGEGAFRGQMQLKAFGVPHSDRFTTIGKEAFAESGLERIDLYDTVTHIREGAFRDCTALSGITLPASLRKIEKEAFAGCTGLESLTLLCEPSALPDGIFDECTGLTSLYTDASSLANELFMNSPLSSVTFGDNLKTIGTDTFRGTGITELVLPATVRKIGKGAFADCTALETVTIHCAASILPPDVFEGCTSLKTVIITKGSIPANFMVNSSIQVLTLGEAVTSIGKNAFANAPLTGVVLPAEITVSTGAFANVPPEEIRISDDADAKTISLLNKVLDRPWYLPVLRLSEAYTIQPMPALPQTQQGFLFNETTGCILGYTGAEKDVIIPDELNGKRVTGITSLAASDSSPSTIETLVLPLSIQTIDAEAFSGCSSLRTFISYGPIENIGEGAFRNCTALETVVFVNGVYDIGVSAFDGCAALSELWWHGTANSIGNFAFRGTALSHFALSARRFGKEAFAQCAGLTEVHLRPETEYVNTLVFDGCLSLRVICFEWNDAERFKRYASIGTVSPEAEVILPADTGRGRLYDMYRILSTGNGGPVAASGEILLESCRLDNAPPPNLEQLLPHS